MKKHGNKNEKVKNGNKNEKVKKHSVPGHFAIKRTHSFLRFRMFSEIAPQELVPPRNLAGQGGEGEKIILPEGMTR